MQRAYLYLKDGSEFVGEAFGSVSKVVGEAVFTTAMNGYVESFTDPSYMGQILVMTHPLIGNYGVPRRILSNGILKNFESEGPKIAGLVVEELTGGMKQRSDEKLDAWLKRHGIPGLQAVDTRELTKRIRALGSMNAVISNRPIAYAGLKKLLAWDYSGVDFVHKASASRIIEYGKRGKKIALLDYGLKHGILDELYSRGFRIIRMPASTSAEKLLSYNPDGVVLTNGPGNPALLSKEVGEVSKLLEYRMPMLGICLGHQVVSMALGMKVKKMKFGHRAINKPVLDLGRKRACITTHNHGYAVYSKGDVQGIKMRFMSPDDGIIEGFESKRMNFITTQFHPEARPGTNDARFVFDEFAKMVG